MKFRRPQPENLEINLTPLIDCLLFLITLQKYSYWNNKSVTVVTLPNIISIFVENCRKNERC